MKIIIKKTKWTAKKTGEITNEETIYEFNEIEKEDNLKWVDFGRTIDPEDMFIVGALPREINFSLKLNQLNKDNVILEFSGEAGGEPKEDSFGYTSKLITLKLNESVGFATKTKDFGINYEVSLMEESEEKNEKMSFFDFNHLYRMRMDFDRVENSIYAPIIYNMEDKYYNAAVKFLEKNIITCLKVNDISIEDILAGYWTDKNEKDFSKRYIESLIILNNIERNGKENAYEIYNPYTIE